MAFDSTGIELTLALDRDRMEASASWTDSEGPRLYRVLVDGRPWLTTRGTTAALPWPHRGRMLVQVGAVDDSEAASDPAEPLPAAVGEGWYREVGWHAGRYLAADGESVVATRLYRSAAPGGAIDYGTPIATRPLWAGPRAMDGFGVGRFGAGGFGRSEMAYSHADGPLSGGTWDYGIRAVGPDGTEGPAAVLSIDVVAPPRPPSCAGPAGERCWHTFDEATGVPTIHWGLSADDGGYEPPDGGPSPGEIPPDEPPPP